LYVSLQTEQSECLELGLGNIYIIKFLQADYAFPKNLVFAFDDPWAIVANF
jgi:hypothetical protein